MEKKLGELNEIFAQSREKYSDLRKELAKQNEMIGAAVKCYTMEKEAIINLDKARQEKEAIGILDKAEQEKLAARPQVSVKCLQEELLRLEEDRDDQIRHVQALMTHLRSYRETMEKLLMHLDNLRTEAKALKGTCSSQSEQVRMLQHQLAAVNEKLMLADLSAIQTWAQFDKQKGTISKLQERLSAAELRLVEGERLRKKQHNIILELKGNIRVFCRVRPSLSGDDLGKERIISYPTSMGTVGQGIELVQGGQKYPFQFDKVFTHKASQQEVFVEISQLVQSALDGYKVCIFAYGQTCSGKTYTMFGKSDAPEQKGLIPRSLEQIFEASQTLSAQGWKYELQASMLEIYNETIRDLLLPSGVTGREYPIKQDANGDTYVANLSLITIHSIEEITSLLEQAAQSRSVGMTLMNEQSSRSHSVFTLWILGVNEKTGEQLKGALNLIDLAGSERLSTSGAMGDRLEETKAINKSLSHLGDVINALAMKKEHVPFRNSKLTNILKPYLSGNSKTAMFVNISPEQSSASESLSSLRFANRVKSCELHIPHPSPMRPESQTSVRPPHSRRPMHPPDL